MKARRKKVMKYNRIRAVITALLMFIGIAILYWLFNTTSELSDESLITTEAALTEETQIPDTITIQEIQPTLVQMYTDVQVSVKSHPNDLADEVIVVPEYEVIDIYIGSQASQWGYTDYGDVEGYVNISNLQSYNEENYLDDLGLEFYYQDLVKELIDIFEFDVDEYFFYGMMYTESRFTNDSQSSAGAQGILQIMPLAWDFLYDELCKDYPDLASTIIDDVFDKRSNITVAMYYIKSIQDDYDLDSLSENAHRVLTMYNRGPGGAKRYYANNNTYVSSYSQEVLRAAEYIRVNQTWKEGL